MTRDEFCSLQRGDLVKVDGNGHCIVEAVCYCDGKFRVDLRLMSGELVKAIPESECEIIRPILGGIQRMTSPETTLGDLLAEKRARTVNRVTRTK
jgi:hypothetical protein